MSLAIFSGQSVKSIILIAVGPRFVFCDAREHIEQIGEEIPLSTFILKFVTNMIKLPLAISNRNLYQKT